MSRANPVRDSEIRSLLHWSGHPRDDVREGAARVRKYDLAIWVFESGAIGYHVHCCAGGFVGVINGRLRKLRVDRVGIDRVRGVDEDDTTSSVELRPYGLYIWVAQVGVGGAVTSEKSDTVGFQGIQSIRYLGEGVLGVENVG